MPVPTVSKQETKVLCIDDDVDMLECLQSFLESFGYTVRVTTSGMEAVELAARWKADAVVVDYSMPAMNGHEVAREIRKARLQIAIILLSGALDIPDETLNLVDAFVEKNRVATHLHQTISSLVGRMPAPQNCWDSLESDDRSYADLWPVEALDREEC